MLDALASTLPSPEDSDRPWLVWYSATERIELTGRVLNMWAAKCAGLIAQECGEGARVLLALEPHWRTVAWYLGAWTASATVLPESEDPAFVETLQIDPPVLVVAFRECGLLPSADIQILVSMESLATRWPEPLPPLVLDGIADVMTHADRFPILPISGSDPALIVPDGDAAVSLSRDDVVAATPRDAARAAREAGAPAFLAHAPTSVPAVLGVLAAWQEGLTAVLVAPDADATVLAAAARQERALPPTPE